MSISFLFTSTRVPEASRDMSAAFGCSFYFFACCFESKSPASSLPTAGAGLRFIICFRNSASSSLVLVGLAAFAVAVTSYPVMISCSCLSLAFLFSSSIFYLSSILLWKREAASFCASLMPGCTSASMLNASAFLAAPPPFPVKSSNTPPE